MIDCFRKSLGRPAAGLVCLWAALVAAEAAYGQGLYINEIYFNLPGRRNFNTDPDSSHAYVEIRGVPCQPLTNTYLVFLENEAEGAGTIEGLFDLTGATLGMNGYLTIRQRAVTDPLAPSQYNDYIVNPKATNLRNAATGDMGKGFGTLGASTVGASWSPNSSGVFSGGFEGSGFTALLIQTDGQPSSVPVVGVDLDVDNNGFDVPNGNAGWTILDSIGFFAEADEALNGRTYSPLTFGFESSLEYADFNPADHIPEGGTYVYIGWWSQLEAEYIGRVGNSTGHAAEDWLIANLTDRPVPAGFSNMGDFRISAEPHAMGAPPETVQSTPYVPYGTAVTNTLGGPNWPYDPISYPNPLAGDFDGDRDVDANDLVWQWAPRFECGDLSGSDLLDWQRNLGQISIPGAVRAQAPVPEPAATPLIAAALLGIRRRRFGRSLRVD